MRHRFVFPSLIMAASIVLVTLTGAPGLAQTVQNTVAMQPGSYYDPRGCNGVTPSGPLYYCAPAANATPVPPTPTRPPVPGAVGGNDSTPVCPSHNATSC